MIQDPFNEVYEAIWDVLENSAELAELVKVGNRIRDLDDLKEHVQTADFPELVLAPAPSTFGLGTTSSYRADENFRVYLSTAKISPETYYRLKWRILRALMKGRKLTDLPAVRNVSVASVDPSMTDPERNRGTRGWSCAFTIQVVMIFNRGDVE